MVFYAQSTGTVISGRHRQTNNTYKQQNRQTNNNSQTNRDRQTQRETDTEKATERQRQRELGGGEGRAQSTDTKILNVIEHNY